MSYDIYFIRKQDLNLDNIYDVLESSEVTPSDDIYISKELMVNLSYELKELGLNFETFEGKNEDYLELNFPSYQISMFNSQIAITLPYWDDNSDEGINKEIKLITNLFIENGLTGFDPQTELFVTEPYEFQAKFNETLEIVEEQIKPESKDNGNNYLMYSGIVLGVAIIGLVIWKILK